MKDISATTIQKETALYGAGTGDTYILALQEQLDVSSLVRESIEDSTVRGSVWDSGNGARLGLRSGELALSVDLCGLGTNAGGAITEDNDSKLIEAAIGACDAGTGTTAAAAGSATVFSVAAADGLLETNMILVETTAGNRVAMIEDIDTLELTVTPPLPVAPAESAKVYAGLNYQPVDTGRTSWIIEHHKDNDAIGYQCVGCTLVPEFTNLGAQEGKAKLSLKVAVGDHDTIPSTLASIDPPDTFTGQGVIQDKGYIKLFDGTNTITCLASTFAVSGLLEQVRRVDACQTNCIGAAEVVPSQNRAVEVELWQESGATADPMAQLKNWYENGTSVELVYQINDAPGETVAFFFPAIYLKAEPTLVNKNGLMAVKCSFKVSIDRNSTVFTKPFYFARF